MNQEKINKEIFTRLSRLEAAISKKEKVAVEIGKASIADHIIVLRDKGVLGHPLTSQEIHKKLESIYPCSLDRVVTAVGRLSRRKQLRKTKKLVGKKKYDAYVW